MCNKYFANHKQSIEQCNRQTDEIENKNNRTIRLVQMLYNFTQIKRKI